MDNLIKKKNFYYELDFADFQINDEFNQNYKNYYFFRDFKANIDATKKALSKILSYDEMHWLWKIFIRSPTYKRYIDINQDDIKDKINKLDSLSKNIKNNILDKNNINGLRKNWSNFRDSMDNYCFLQGAAASAFILEITAYYLFLNDFLIREKYRNNFIRKLNRIGFASGGFGVIVFSFYGLIHRPENDFILTCIYNFKIFENALRDAFSLYKVQASEKK